MMTEKERIARQDLVDNAIFDLIKIVNPTENEIKWDISLISEIRMAVADVFVKKLKLCTEYTFYPWVK